MGIKTPLALFCLAGLVACADHSDGEASVRIVLDETLPEAPFTRLGGELGQLKPLSLSPPSNATEIDCMGIFAGYPDGENNRGECEDDNEESIPVAQVDGLTEFSRGKTLTLSGLIPERELSLLLFGIRKPTNQRCVGLAPGVNFENLGYSRPSVLGFQDIKLEEGLNSANISLDFPGTYIESCDEGVLGSLGLHDDLEAFWNFDEATNTVTTSSGAFVNSTSGSRNTLTWTGGKNVAGTGIFGNNARLSDGSTIYLDTPAANIPDLSFSSGEDFSFSAWFYFTGDPSASTRNLLLDRLEPSGTSGGYRISRYNQTPSNNYLAVELGCGSATCGDGGSIGFNRYPFTSCQLPKATVLHVVVTVENKLGGKMKAYINDEKCGGTKILKNSMTNAPGRNLIIRSPDHAKNFFMDAAGIWSRVLRASDIEKLYNDGTGRQYPLE